MPAEDTPEKGTVDVVMGKVNEELVAAADDPGLDPSGDNSVRTMFLTNDPRKEIAAGVRDGPEEVVVVDRLLPLANDAGVEVVEVAVIEVLPDPEAIAIRTIIDQV
uniref:Uncharacterized protein n=1 Tax=Amphimedon queenslandica TaxID=400682 RepID=A0A1X7VMU0_AMPQE